MDQEPSGWSHSKQVSHWGFHYGADLTPKPPLCDTGPGPPTPGKPTQAPASPDSERDLPTGGNGMPPGQVDQESSGWSHHHQVSHRGLFYGEKLTPKPSLCDDGAEKGEDVHAGLLPAAPTLTPTTPATLTP